jgi:hypothetical protein
MFTTLAALRNSSAQQGRVTKVENWLKKQNKDWKPEYIFPMVVVQISNTLEDYEWVLNSIEETTLPSKGITAAYTKSVKDELAKTFPNGLLKRTKAQVEQSLEIYNKNYKARDSAQFVNFFVTPISAVVGPVTTAAPKPAAKPVAATKASNPKKIIAIKPVLLASPKVKANISAVAKTAGFSAADRSVQTLGEILTKVPKAELRRQLLALRETRKDIKVVATHVTTKSATVTITV